MGCGKQRVGPRRNQEVDDLDFRDAVAERLPGVTAGCQPQDAKVRARKQVTGLRVARKGSQRQITHWSGAAVEVFPGSCRAVISDFEYMTRRLITSRDVVPRVRDPG